MVQTRIKPYLQQVAEKARRAEQTRVYRRNQVFGLLLVAFAILQALRLWVIVSLGPFWTTRVITIDLEPPVRKGPYRYFRHPNYLVVALEIPVLSLAVGVPWVALAFGVLNVALLLYRIKIEDAARRGIAPANR